MASRPYPSTPLPRSVPGASDPGPLRTFLLLNVLGGIAVLGSYVHGFVAYPEVVSQMWGGVPDAWRPLYTTNMFLAAAGYFAFTSFVLVRVLRHDARVADRFGLGFFSLLYAAILIPSALWMPLTYWMVTSPGDLVWLLVRLDLALVGLGSLGVLASLFQLRPATRGPFFWLAVVGALAFCLQTAVLDAVVWPAFFPR